MAVDFHIRLVETRDIQQVLDIYAPFILETTTSFETEVPTLEDFTDRVKRYSAQAPWLVAADGNTVLGYAYATSHRSREAYQWCQEVTVYVHPDHRRKGVARALYSKLLEMLKAMGFSKALGIITLPNDASIATHHNLGFTHIGDMKDIGYKLGDWHSTSWWELALQAPGFVPSATKPVSAVKHLLET